MSASEQIAECLKENHSNIMIAANDDSKYRAQLDQLLDELKEGDLTEKGYIKKREKLLSEYEQRFGRPLFATKIDKKQKVNESSVTVPRTFKRRKRTNQSFVVDDVETDSLAQPKIAEQVQHLANTLKAKKKMVDFGDDDGSSKSTSCSSRHDCDTPKPNGPLCSPVFGGQIDDEMIIVDQRRQAPSGSNSIHSCNLIGALVLHGKNTRRSQSNVITVLSSSGKACDSLTFARLLNKSRKIAYSLIQKTHTSAVLAYQRHELAHFVAAFYGCMMASVTPILVQGYVDLLLASRNELCSDENVKFVLLSHETIKSLGHFDCDNKQRKVEFMVSEKLDKPSKHWSPPVIHGDTLAYVERERRGDNEVLDVGFKHNQLLAHCELLSKICGYVEGDVIVTTANYQTSVALWHVVQLAVYVGMQIVFVAGHSDDDSGRVKNRCGCQWIHAAHKYRATVVIVSSRDLARASPLKTREMADLSCVRMILLTDQLASSSESQTNVNSFLRTFGSFARIRPNCLWSCAYSTESMTFAIGPLSAEKETLSMFSLCHLVVQPEHVASGAAVSLGSSGRVLPNCVVATVKIDGAPYLCRSDEIGEFVVSTPSMSSSGIRVCPLYPDGMSISCEEQSYFFIRTGLYGFFNTAGYLIVVTDKCSLITTHDFPPYLFANHLKWTLSLIDCCSNRGGKVVNTRLTVFPITVLSKQRLVVVAELNKELGCCQSDQCSFAWMNFALRTIESSHYVCAYCILLVSPNRLPIDQSGSVDRLATRDLFKKGLLHPLNVLVCPHLCLADLSRRRESVPSSLLLASTLSLPTTVNQNRTNGTVGNSFLIDILISRCQSAPHEILYSALNAKSQTAQMSSEQIYKKLDKVLCVLLDRISNLRIQPEDKVILLFTPSITLELVPIYLACTKLNLVPIPLRSAVDSKRLNLNAQMSLLRPCINMLNPKLIITNIAQLQSNEISHSNFPHVLVIETLSRQKTSLQSAICSPVWRRQPTNNQGALISFEQREDGCFEAAEITYSTLSEICRTITKTVELYPSREILLCVDPFARLGFVLWNVMSVYAGHESILLPQSELESNPFSWFSAISQRQVRDVFLSFSAIEIIQAHVDSVRRHPDDHCKSIPSPNSLESVRSCVILCDGRVPYRSVRTFTETLRLFGLDSSAVSACLSCSANFLMCLQKPNEPDTSVVSIDRRELAFDRIVLTDDLSSLDLMESGRVLPNVQIAIIDRRYRTRCSELELGELYVQSSHNTDRIMFSHERNGGVSEKVVDGTRVFIRSGLIGFSKKVASSEHDAVYIVGNVNEILNLRGLTYYPSDIEATVNDLPFSGRSWIDRSACFMWSKLVVVAIEWTGSEADALDLVPLVTSAIADQHQVIVGVVVIVDPGSIPVFDNKTQRFALRNGFLSDSLNPMFVVYNM